MLIDGGFGSKLALAKYVRKHEQVNGKLPSAYYSVSIFDGDAWTDSLGTHDEKPFGGFTKDVKFVGTYAIAENEASIPTLSFSFFSVQGTHISISYDGKALSKKY
jgi:hypothetical protein